LSSGLRRVQHHRGSPAGGFRRVAVRLRLRTRRPRSAKPVASALPFPGIERASQMDSAVSLWSVPLERPHPELSSDREDEVWRDRPGHDRFGVYLLRDGSVSGSVVKLSNRLLRGLTVSRRKSSDAQDYTRSGIERPTDTIPGTGGGAGSGTRTGS